MRNIDKTPHECRLCGSLQTVGGFRTHLKTKHPEHNTQSYIVKFGEFRPKKIEELQKITDNCIICKECNLPVHSYKKLMHHIKIHNMNFKEYHIKHTFGGTHPLCKCGCGSPVQILKSGIIDSTGNRVWAREFLSGHNTCMQIGVQTRSHSSKMKMRESAINRMSRNGKRFSPDISSAQLEIFNYITSISSGFTQNDTSLLHGREIDIINHSSKIGIEYNGLYFHSDKYKQRNYHLSKTNEMERLGYRLIYIWEDWWIRKKEIVKSMLSSILNATKTKIYARNCVINEITDYQARVFLHNTHIQGACVSKIRLGLYYNNELVSVMTFGKLRKTLGTKSKDGAWELLRFSTKLNTTVIGGASKLLSYFVKTYKPYTIISYAKRDWSTGNLYKKLGFKFDGETEPGYFYAKGKRRFNRSQFTKDKLIKQGAAKTKSESLIMSEMGYLKVWDTGNLKYSLDIKNNK